ncbi:hypothetical protein OG943_19645 [Amycolatopsis sp. NBC_00345]|uniref:hypothetical protein n=1 Tax=Amycolatopsis sp. NBC_00345 TaxID=2975955 RepID=UPI002E272202
MRRPLLLLSAVPAVLMVGGVGAGGTAAAAEPPEPVTLNAVGEPVADLLPGRTGAAQFTVTNPNGFGVRLVSLFFDRVKSSSNPVGCPVGLLTTNDRQPAGGLFVPASGKASFVVPGALTLSAAATDACLGVTFIVETRAVGVADDRGASVVPPTGTAPGPPGSGPEAGVPVGTGHEGSGPVGEQASNSGSGPGKLAFTGVSVLALTGIALALLLAGIALRLLGARRRRAQGARR